MSNGPEFFQTRMGATFFEHTMPELVKQLKRIANALERSPGHPDPVDLSWLDCSDCRALSKSGATPPRCEAHR